MTHLSVINQKYRDSNLLRATQEIRFPPTLSLSGASVLDTLWTLQKYKLGLGALSWVIIDFWLTFMRIISLGFEKVFRDGYIARLLCVVSMDIISYKHPWNAMTWGLLFLM